MRSLWIVALALCGAAVPAAGEQELCWSGWGYFVAPGSLAFESDRFLLVTRGPVDWRPGARVELLRLDPGTGRIDRQAHSIVVQLRRPRFGSREGNRTMDDIAEVEGSPRALMFGMTRIASDLASGGAQGRSLDWACGRGEE